MLFFEKRKTKKKRRISKINQRNHQNKSKQVKIGKENTIIVDGIVNDEIGNWIDKGIVYYNNAKYQFDDYYYNGDGFVMLRFEDVEEDTEVGVISHYLVRIVELEKNVYFVEDVNVTSK